MAPPTHILRQPETHTLLLRWADGNEHVLPYAFLRRKCCCAGCIHEITGEQLLDPATVPEDLDLPHMNLVGNYAIKFRWSDDHDQGLYTWQYLRELAGMNA
ncbi:MAG: DUF971 domain-containing protein [Planctomycetes bacterium]|jgi:DUF971 family protein|nr:DUF971 domain-containing protein [Planctomycetota bacterium]